MLGVLLAENGMFCRYAPVDAQRVIEYAYAAVSLRMVELVALVLKYCRLAQHGKAMGESFRDEKLPVIVFCQFHGDMLTVCGDPLRMSTATSSTLPLTHLTNFACVNGGR